MSSHGGVSGRSSVSRSRDQAKQEQSLQKYLPKSCTGRAHHLKREKNLHFSDSLHEQEDEDDEKVMSQNYGNRAGKATINTDSRTGLIKPVHKSENSGVKHTNMLYPDAHCPQMCRNFMGLRGVYVTAPKVFDKMSERNELDRNKLSLVPYKDQDVSDKGYKENYNLPNNYENYDVYDKKTLLKEFRKIYEKMKVSKPSVRNDQLAWKELEKKLGKVLEPIQTFGLVSDVEIEDTFNLRLELIIMGIHFQQVHGIDYMPLFPSGELRATSVVATEGYEDNMIDPNVLMYTGEGGSFEGGRGGKSGKKVKDQVMSGGNLALKNSMVARNDVRVVRGMRPGGGKNKPIFVYDGLYKVVDCKEIVGPFGNKQFQFKLARKSGQKSIVWAKYK